MNCVWCGTHNFAGATHCAGCGRQIGPVASEVPTEPVAQGPDVWSAYSAPAGGGTSSASATRAPDAGRLGPPLPPLPPPAGAPAQPEAHPSGNGSVPPDEPADDGDAAATEPRRSRTPQLLSVVAAGAILLVVLGLLLARLRSDDEGADAVTSTSAPGATATSALAVAPATTVANPNPVATGRTRPATADDDADDDTQDESTSSAATTPAPASPSEDDDEPTSVTTTPAAPGTVDDPAPTSDPASDAASDPDPGPDSPPAAADDPPGTPEPPAATAAPPPSPTTADAPPQVAPAPVVTSPAGSGQAAAPGANVLDDPLPSGLPAAAVGPALTLAQSFADALAAGDFDAARRLSPGLPSDASLEDGYRGLDRATLLLVDARQGQSGGYELLVALIANERAGAQTTIFCVESTVSASGTVAQTAAAPLDRFSRTVTLDDVRADTVLVELIRGQCVWE